MLEFQKETNKEISGFFTESGKMIVLPNNHPEQDSNNSVTSSKYKDSEGTTLYSFYKYEGAWYVNYFSSDGTLLSFEKVVGHYHTYPFGGGLSQLDKDFANAAIGTYAGANIAFYYTTGSGNNIYKYNQNEVTGTENTDCKNNPETVNCN